MPWERAPVHFLGCVDLVKLSRLEQQAILVLSWSSGVFVVSIARRGGARQHQVRCDELVREVNARVSCAPTCCCDPKGGLQCEAGVSVGFLNSL